MEGGTSNILVAIRVRPLNQREINQGEFDVARVEDNLIIILDPIEMEFVNENKKMLEVYHRSKEQRYAFDKIFRDDSQEEIYENTCKHLINPVMQGYNATVFAYGPTGAGKTHTMLGTNEVPGLCVLTINDIFKSIRSDQDNDYDLRITYVEIYNETIRDLLSPQSSYLELRDDPIRGITISGVTEFKAESTEQVMNLLFMGNKRRTTESTNANQTSSRSHAVFQILVYSTSRVKNTDQETLTGKLSLIDLAGSERGTVTENRGIRLREGAKINQSLLALANCINALGDKSKKGFFVPYRDSKLTRLLKDSLGGNCKTVMISCVSPASSQFEETINTLKYANRAKNIKTKVMANKRLVSMHIAEYKNIINDLRSEIEQLKSKIQNQMSDNGESLNMDENESINNNYAGGKVTVSCTCGRAEDEENLKKIQEEIFENFQDRIQLRRALMEIEEQNAMNILEIKKKQTEIAMQRKQDIGNILDNHDENIYQENGKGNGKMTDEVKNNLKQIKTLKMATEQNRLKKDMMNLQLLENIANAKKIRDQIPKKIKYKDKRNYLQLVIKNHVLELQNIELEINLQIQEKTIQDLKNIIEAQRKTIIDNNIESKQDDQNQISYNSDNDLDLELEDMFEDEQDQEDNLQQNEEDAEIDDLYKDMENNENKKPKNESFPDINSKKRDKSAMSNKPNLKTSQDKINQQQFSLQIATKDEGNSYLDIEDEASQSPRALQVRQRRKDDSKKAKDKPKTKSNAPVDKSSFNSISITGQSALNQKDGQVGKEINNYPSNKQMPSIQKQIGLSKDPGKEMQKDKDSFGNNVKVKNFVLPQLGENKQVKDKLQSNQKKK